MITSRRCAWALWAVLPRVITPLRTWDYVAAQRVDAFIANARTTARRIATFYRREATVLHPPIDVSRYYVAPTLEPYFLVLARLQAYKRIDVAIEAFNRLRWPLLIIGDGHDAASLRHLAGPTIRFAGRADNKEVLGHLRHCHALIWPGEEDLGLAPLEALASGRRSSPTARGPSRKPTGTFCSGVRHAGWSNNSRS